MRWLALFLLLAACDAKTSIEGQVLDVKGQPIQNASVWLIYADWQPIDGRTDAQGHFSTGATHRSHSDHLTLLVSAPGYKLYYKAVTSPPAENLKVVLEQGDQTELTAPNQ